MIESNGGLRGVVFVSHIEVFRRLWAAHSRSEVISCRLEHRARRFVRSIEGAALVNHDGDSSALLGASELATGVARLP